MDGPFGDLWNLYILQQIFQNESGPVDDSHVVFAMVLAMRVTCHVNAMIKSYTIGFYCMKMEIKENIQKYTCINVSQF